MTIYPLSDVFNEAQVPTLTFVPPREFPDIVGSLRTKGKHVTLCGPSGCGKTTLAEKALAKAKVGPGEQHWLSGRDYSSCATLDDMLSKAFACNREETLGWLKACGVLVIDDFHHLKESVRHTLARALKRWHELGIRCFVIGIAESAHQLLETDSELGIRNDPYDMKTQDEAFIEQVVAAGEKALNVSFSAATRKDFVVAAKGVPSAIQVICRVACLRADVAETQVSCVPIDASIQDIKDGVLRIYRGKYHNKIIGFAKGKQQAQSVHNT